MVERIRKNLEQVQERIARAARAVGRQPESVRLVVVTKGHPVETVRAAVQAGARWLGENYAEEAVAKMQALGELPGVSWHMIGHVQRRKARLVVEHFDWLHSLDRVKLARRLETLAAERGRRLSVLLECNVSGEASKFGFPAWDETQWDVLFPQVEDVLACEHLEVRGLMTIAPLVDDPEAARPYFRQLRVLRDALARRYPQATWDELSMGMSGDFEVAVQEGATFVRIGTAILGPRKT